MNNLLLYDVLNTNDKEAEAKIFQFYSLTSQFNFIYLFIEVFEVLQRAIMLPHIAPHPYT